MSRLADTPQPNPPPSLHNRVSHLRLRDALRVAVICQGIRRRRWVLLRRCGVITIIKYVAIILLLPASRAACHHSSPSRNRFSLNCNSPFPACNHSSLLVIIPLLPAIKPLLTASQRCVSASSSAQHPALQACDASGMPLDHHKAEPHCHALLPMLSKPMHTAVHRHHLKCSCC